MIFYFLFYKNNYTEFEPILFENNSYRKIDVDSMFNINLVLVLDYNNVVYKINEKGKVLVSRSLFEDKELVFNYTKKSLDTSWIRIHAKLK